MDLNKFKETYIKIINESLNEETIKISKKNYPNLIHIINMYQDNRREQKTNYVNIDSNRFSESDLSKVDKALEELKKKPEDFDIFFDGRIPPNSSEDIKLADKVIEYIINKDYKWI